MHVRVERKQLLINGQWVDGTGGKTVPVINPATEAPVGKILLGTAEDVDAAVRAARAAFETYSQTTREERIAYLDNPELIRERVKPHVEALLWAEHLVFVYPTWFHGPPSMLKGWLERVWLPGVAK